MAISRVPDCAAFLMFIRSARGRVIDTPLRRIAGWSSIPSIVARPSIAKLRLYARGRGRVDVDECAVRRRGASIGG